MIKTLPTEQILQIHYELVAEFEQGDDPITPAGPRDINLLHSASSRPLTSLGGVEKYNTTLLKAAALFHSLAMNHAFHNGNKRTALVSLLVFLDGNKQRFESSDDELFNFVISVADNKLRDSTKTGHSDEVIVMIEDWISKHTRVVSQQISEMKIADFLAKCQLAGCKVKKSAKGAKWIVFGVNNDSVSISASTPRLTGKVVMKYVNKLGMSSSISGVYMDEFQAGVKPEQRLIRRFRTVLKRLAHA